MRRRFTLVGLPMTCVLLLAATVAPAAEEILKLVPDSAWGFVVVNRPAAADAKLQALARQIQLPLPGLWTILKQRSGVQEGWNESGSIALLILPPKVDSAVPTAILLVPVTDYAKVVGQLHPEDATQPVTKIEISHTAFWVRHIGGYAALTDVSHREALEKTLTLAKDIPAALAPWREWLTGKDIAGVILPLGIKQISAKAQAGIRATKSMLAAQADPQAKAAAGMFDIYAKLFQAAEGEISAYGFALQLDEQNVLRLTDRALLTPGGTWARLVAQNRPSQEDLLAGLPAEPFVAGGGAMVSGAVWEAMQKLSVAMMQSARSIYGISQEQGKRLSALSMDAMKGSRAFSMMLGTDQQGGPIFSNVVAVIRVDHAPAFMAAYERDLRKNAELMKGLHSPMLPPMEVAKSEVGGTPALQLTTKVPQPPAGRQIPQQARMMEIFFGPGGKMIAWIVPADEQHVVIGYSKAPLQRAMEAIRQGKPGLAGDAGVAKTAALLPSGAVAAAYLSPAETIAFVQRIVSAIVPPGVKVDLKLPDFPKTPPLGFAVTTAAAVRRIHLEGRVVHLVAANELQGCVVVPAEVLQAIGPYVRQVQAMRSGASTKNDLAEQLREAKSGNFWAKYRLWAAYQKGTDGAEKNPEEARKWLAEVVQGMYLATFRPVKGFAPRTPGEFLAKFSEYSTLRSESTGLGGASFFRTQVKDGALVGSFLTAYPDKMRQAIAANPSLELISLEKVTPEMFIRYEASPQESLQSSQDGHTAKPAGDPPRIVSTSPADGAKDVDPATAEVTVTFDREMGPSFTWNGDGPDYPFLPEAKAFWRDRRTCVLPVKLEAGHSYHVGLNLFSPNWQSFRSLEGVPALPTAIDFATRGTRKPDGSAAAPKGRPEPPRVEPNSKVVVEGVGWKSFRVSATREELIKAYGDPDPNPGNSWVRWTSKYHVDCFLGGDGRAVEVRFNQGFNWPLTSGVKIGSSEKEVLSAYGVPDSVVQQPQAKMLVYDKRGVLMWVMDGKVFDFTVIVQGRGAGPRFPVIGIGVAIGKENGPIRVLKVLAETPAKSAGLQPGDELRQIDGRPVTGNLDEVAKRIRGKADTVVKIKVRKKDGTEVELAIRRRPIYLLYDGMERPPSAAQPRRPAEVARAPASPTAKKAVEKAAQHHVAVRSAPRPDARAVEEALAAPTTLEFLKTPLSDVVDYLRDFHKIEIQFDSKALRNAGIKCDTPITINLKGIRLRSALRLLLHDIGLTSLVDDGFLLITTPEAADERLSTVVYPVEDLVACLDQAGQPRADYDGLIEVITSTCKPTSWDTVGGAGSIAPMENRVALVIAQTYEVQRQIAQLLADLRRLPPAKVLPSPPQPAKTKPGSPKAAPPKPGAKAGG